MKTIVEAAEELGKSKFTLYKHIEALGLKLEREPRGGFNPFVLSEDQVNTLKNYNPKNGRPRKV